MAGKFQRAACDNIVIRLPGPFTNTHLSIYINLLVKEDHRSRPPDAGQRACRRRPWPLSANI